ncbi:hypothetical protein ACJJIP_15670 [Microbulbifer sp. VTAC004]|uniref:hypothetical protein n=1 Tax=Microbulbifer sp. VTAC004 TaxID=3243386 RepID=UPI00403983C1
MDKLKVELSNCYGISSFDEVFDFTNDRNQAKAYAIYAPNGLMKTSFSKTFEALSRGELPKEERFNRESNCVVEADDSELQKERIYVLKSEIDIASDNDAVTNILINEESKSRYDSLVAELTRIKSKLISSLQKKSKVKKSDLEKKLITDFDNNDFIQCIKLASNFVVDGDLSNFAYGEIFEPKAAAILESQEFTQKADEFNSRYQELFDKAGSIYKRGVFNPIKADSSFSTLKKNGFFEGGHKVHLLGDEQSIDHDQLQEKIRVVHESIDGDEELKKIRDSLAKNAQTQSLAELFEKLSAENVEYLLSKLKKENQQEFKTMLWASYVQSCEETNSLISTYDENKEEIDEIESAAATEAPNWSRAIELFNDRFVDMPFTLSLFNQAEAALGKERAKLKFTFKDGEDQVDCTRSQVTSLSQGEKRALYLLNFVFEVEDRKRDQRETLFVIDDAADSFDYKNKHAIVQYLEDISDTSYFSQIILTHNFDFFRTLANNFVHRNRCMMANRSRNSIDLSKAEGIKNYFVNIWKRQIENNEFVLCATVPFTRNIIEYTKGEADADYLKLTSLLHWKSDTAQITVGEYITIYNDVFGTQHSTNNNKPLIDLLFEKADEISDRDEHDGLNLEDKVLLSIAIRLKSEIFITNELRIIKSDSNYWCQSFSQFGALIKEYSAEQPTGEAIRSLEKVSITVSSNIHLNSFMYEPILDLTIEHLIALYTEIKQLELSENIVQETEEAL